MDVPKPTVVVTGISGNLGSRLLPMLSGFRVIGIDKQAPAFSQQLGAFVELDLGRESACEALVQLLAEEKVTSVVHLAFVIDPVRTGVLENDRMWQINVSGTARVMEAISVHNRRGGAVKRFIFPSSVSAYGSELAMPATEETPLAGHTLAYAVHKREADLAVQARAPHMNGCSTFILRPHIFVGSSVENYIVGALRGIPTGKGRMAARLRADGRKLPMLLPLGKSYLAKRWQFLHVDDIARLIIHILHAPTPKNHLEIMNVAGRGESITMEQCAEIANSKILRLPTAFLCGAVLKLLWKLRISSAPPEALPYMIGSYTMDCSRLRAYLGDSYDKVIQHTETFFDGRNDAASAAVGS